MSSKSSSISPGAKWTGMVANENAGCGKNMKSLFSDAGMAYSEIIERFEMSYF